MSENHWWPLRLLWCREEPGKVLRDISAGQEAAWPRGVFLAECGNEREGFIQGPQAQPDGVGLAVLCTQLGYTTVALLGLCSSHSTSGTCILRQNSQASGRNIVSQLCLRWQRTANTWSVQQLIKCTPGSFSERNALQLFKGWGKGPSCAQENACRIPQCEKNGLQDSTFVQGRHFWWILAVDVSVYILLSDF